MMRSKRKRTKKINFGLYSSLVMKYSLSEIFSLHPVSHTRRWILGPHDALTSVHPVVQRPSHASYRCRKTSLCATGCRRNTSGLFRYIYGPP
ncbi:unnamed protein product [Prunus brigantina]